MYVTHRSFAAPAPAIGDFFWLYHTYSLLRGGFCNALSGFGLWAKTLWGQLSKSRATGLDKISAKLLRICADLIANSLSLIFNTSIATGIYPEEWKCSKLVPVFKQGDRADLDNYRPISIIPVVAKVFEKIIYDHLYAYFMANNLLSTHQSGLQLPLYSRRPMIGRLT